MNINQNLECRLPASLDAERGILGAILLDNKHYSRTARMLTEDDFLLDGYRRTYRRMRELHDSKCPVDMISRGDLRTKHIGKRALIRAESLELYAGASEQRTVGSPERPTNSLSLRQIDEDKARG